MQLFTKVSSLVNRFKWKRLWLIFILYSMLSLFFIFYIFVMQLLSKADYFTIIITLIAIIILLPISLLGLFALKSQIHLMEIILKGSGMESDKHTEDEYSKIQSMKVLVDEIRSKTARIQELEKEIERLSLKILKRENELKTPVSLQKNSSNGRDVIQKKEETTVTEERRKFARANQVIEINFKDTESFIKAYIGNVSGGGLFIKTEEPVELNESLIVKFFLPNDLNPITAEGKVVWVTPRGVKNPSYPPGFGLKFVHLKPEDRKKLDDFISQISSQNTFKQ